MVGEREKVGQCRALFGKLPDGRPASLNGRLEVFVLFQGHTVSLSVLIEELQFAVKLHKHKLLQLLDSALGLDGDNSDFLFVVDLADNLVFGSRFFCFSKVREGLRWDGRTKGCALFTILGLRARSAAHSRGVGARGI